MIKFVRQQAWFIIPYSIFFLLSTFVLASFSKTEIHLFFNQYHHKFADIFFKTITHLGDGFFATVVVIALIFIKWRYSLLVALSTSSSGIVVQTLKRLVFDECKRPKAYFPDFYDLNFVSGVDVHSSYSFPSGHTTCAFALYFSLALCTRHQWLKCVFFIVALLAGYSRIYLSQHFLADVYAGSFLGVAFAMLFYILISRYRTNWMEKSALYNRKSATH